MKQQLVRLVKAIFPKLWMEVIPRLFPRRFERELKLVRILCDSQSNAIDIGANQGIYSYFMSKSARQVVAFEPNVDLWPSLTKALNPNVQLEEAALSDRASDAILKIDRSNTGISSIEEKNDLRCDNSADHLLKRMVQTRTLDSFQISNVSLIKIDVEGHEEAVVRGAYETIKQSQPVLIIESEDRHNAGAPHRLMNFLSDMNYDAFYIFGSAFLSVRDLRDIDTNVANMADDHVPYINNFVFIPSNRPELVRKVRAFCEGTAA